MLLILACSHDSLICLVELAFPRELLVGCLVGCLVLSLVVNANQTCWCSFVGCCLVAVRLPSVGPALLAVCVLCLAVLGCFCWGVCCCWLCLWLGVFLLCCCLGSILCPLPPLSCFRGLGCLGFTFRSLWLMAWHVLLRGSQQPCPGRVSMCVDLINKSKTCADFSFQQGWGSLRSVATDWHVQRRLQTDGDTNISIYIFFFLIILH